MKKLLYLIIALLCISAVSAFAQDSPDTKKMSEAELKQLENKLKKESKELKKEEKSKPKSKKTSNSFDVVGQFPEQFVDQSLRFKDVPLTIKSITREGTTSYYIELFTPKWKRFTTEKANNTLSFVMPEDIGHGTFTFFEEFKHLDQIRTNVSVDLKLSTSETGEKYYLANVTCIELLGVFGQKLKKLGTCE